MTNKTNGIELGKKLPTSNTSIQLSGGLSKFIFNLKENKKKPKYNFASGMSAGMFVTKVAMVQGFIESDSKSKYAEDILEQIYEICKMLVETYNWKRENLLDLYQQCFKEEQS